MNQVLVELIKMNITDPAKIRRIAWLIENAAHGGSIATHAENILIEMTEQELELATQQILGGR
jgi:hypothetical protein